MIKKLLTTPLTAQATSRFAEFDQLDVSLVHLFQFTLPLFLYK
jgi:hypothetical protein